MISRDLHRCLKEFVPFWWQGTRLPEPLVCYVPWSLRTGKVRPWRGAVKRGGARQGTGCHSYLPRYLLSYLQSAPKVEFSFASPSVPDPVTLVLPLNCPARQGTSPPPLPPPLLVLTTQDTISGQAASGMQ